MMSIWKVSKKNKSSTYGTSEISQLCSNRSPPVNGPVRSQEQTDPLLMGPQTSTLMDPQMNPLMGPQMSPLIDPQMIPSMDPVMSPLMGSQMSSLMNPQMSPLMDLVMRPLMGQRAHYRSNKGLI